MVSFKKCAKLIKKYCANEIDIREFYYDYISEYFLVNKLVPEGGCDGYFRDVNELLKVVDWEWNLDKGENRKKLDQFLELHSELPQFGFLTIVPADEPKEAKDKFIKWSDKNKAFLNSIAEDSLVIDHIRAENNTLKHRYKIRLAGCINENS